MVMMVMVVVVMMMMMLMVKVRYLEEPLAWKVTNSRSVLKSRSAGDNRCNENDDDDGRKMMTMMIDEMMTAMMIMTCLAKNAVGRLKSRK